MMVEINLHGRRPGTVLPIGALEELREWVHQRRTGTVTIGAALPYADMESGELAVLVPALAQAARTVGSPQIRAAGTIGGNLGTCSPPATFSRCYRPSTRSFMSCIAIILGTSIFPTS